MTVKSSISLTDEQDAFVQGLVRAGRYSSASAVLQQGIDLLRRQVEADEADTEALRLLLRARLDEPLIPASEMRERVEAMIERKGRDATG